VTDSTALFVSKTNADGSYGWTRVLDADPTSGPQQSVAPTALAVDGQGAVLLTGSYTGTFDFAPGASIERHTTRAQFGEPYVLKLTSAGAFAWARTFTAATDRTYCTSLALATAGDGSVFVAGSGGYCDVDLDPGAAVVATPAMSERFLVVLDASGNYAWGRAYDGLGCDGAFDDVTVAPDGAMWGVGLVNGDNSGMAICVQALEADGRVRGSWKIGPAGIGTGAVPHVTASTDGSIYLGGEYNGTVDFDPGPNVATQSAASSGFVVKLASDGAFRWVQSFPVPVLDAASTPDGGVVAAVGGSVMKLYADDTAAWTLATPGFARSIVSGPAGFLVAGPAGDGGVTVWRYTNPAP
jgi:hypothetical protein